MKTAAILSVLLGLGFAIAVPAFATNFGEGLTVIYGQDQCKDGEKWDEATQKCVKGE